MSSIQTGIELNDQFSGVLYGIIDAVNLTLSSMYDMQQSMSADIDTSSIEGAREEISRVTAELHAMNEAISSQNAQNVRFQANAPPEPVQWEVDDLETFTNTGIERFQQEIQSANGILEQLGNTQDAIARQAYSMNILPPDAFQEMNRLADRIDLVRGRIQQIESNPVNIGTDTANAQLEQLRVQLSQAVQEQEALNQAMQDMDVSAVNAAYLRLSQAVRTTERYIRDNVDEQGRLNQKIQDGVQQSDRLMNTIKGAVAAYVSLQTVGKVLDLSDEMTQTTSRLNQMNDGMQSTQELTNMVYAAAQDARGSFADMANVVARFGNNAGDAFSSSQEVVAFADLVQKQMTIAGAGTQEASNAMLQLSQALGSGVLRGDELNSIFEQAPNLIQSIADYLDVPIGQIRDMASEGQISADIVKNAIFASADEINAKFEEMPMTWGQVWQSMQNTALIAFQPVLERVNQLANSEEFQGFVDGAVEAMATLALIVLNIFDLIAMVGEFTADNWSVISPIIYGVVAALAVYALYLGIVNGMELAAKVVKGAMAVAEGIHAAALVVTTGATWAAATAQLNLNGAMYACPIVWIIILIIALIAVIIALCSWIANVTGAANSGIGIIMGALAVAFAFILNILIGIMNAVVKIVADIHNIFANFAAAFGILFNDPVAAIKAVFLSMLNFIIGIVSQAASIIDAIVGFNLEDKVESVRNGIQAEIDATIENAGGTAAETGDTSNPDFYLKRIEYGEAFGTGAALGDGIADKISNFFGGGGLLNPEDYEQDPAVYTSGFQDLYENSGMGDNLDDIAGDTAAIKDSMDISQEDLKYLRDIAEQEAINRFTTAEIKLDMVTNNNVSSSADLDGIVDGLTNKVLEAMETVKEGV